MYRIITTISLVLLLIPQSLLGQETEIEQDSLAGQVPQSNEADSLYRLTLDEMFEVTGSEEIYSAAIQQMFVMVKTQYPIVEETIWTALEEEFSKSSLKDLTTKLIPVYKKYYTKEDLEGVIKFYNSPVGKRFAKHTPAIMQESMQIGQAWGMKIGKELEEKLKEEGY